MNRFDNRGDMPFAGHRGPHMGTGGGRMMGEGRGHGMGFANMYRFLVPVVAVCLKKLGKAHGYQIAQEAAKLSVTGNVIDAAGVYRVLRRMEEMGFVHSEWDTTGAGPAKRNYMITDEGEINLEAIMERLRRISGEMAALIGTYDEIKGSGPSDK